MSNLPVDIDRLSRRPPGDRLLVYLDQSALSDFVRKPELSGTLAFIRSEVESGRVLCPQSHEHHDETMRAPRELWSEIERLGDELSNGIRMRPRAEIEWEEIHIAAAAFLDAQVRDRPMWREAFTEDPHVPREDLFFEFLGSQIRVNVRFEPDEDSIAEVEHERSKEEPMTDAYRDLRQRFTFYEMAEANIAEMIRWLIGPLVDPGHHFHQVAQRYVAWESTADTDDPDIGPGSPWRRLQAFAMRGTQTKYLIERFPRLEARAQEFATSSELRHMPTIAYPALLRAGLAATRAEAQAG